jgi:hypothetical protein
LSDLFRIVYRTALLTPQALFSVRRKKTRLNSNFAIRHASPSSQRYLAAAFKFAQ